MLSAGAQILDIGNVVAARSTHHHRRRGDATGGTGNTGFDEEFPEAIISLDTVYAHSVRAGYDLGVGLINDISAGRPHSAMHPTVAELGLPYVLMHMQGQPGTMQSNPVYADVVTDVLDFFIAEVGKLRVLGVKDIVLDPGFGFGKTIAHNYQLLKSMHVFRMLDVPLLAGLSRKSMIYRFLY